MKQPKVEFHDENLYNWLHQVTNCGMPVMDDCDIFIPNKKVPNCIDFKADEASVIDIVAVNIPLERTEFSWNWKKHIDVLRQAYGEANVEVCWGFVQYYG